MRQGRGAPGIKLAANEHVAYLTLGGKPFDPHQFTELSARSKLLAVYGPDGVRELGPQWVSTLAASGAIAPRPPRRLRKARDEGTLHRVPGNASSTRPWPGCSMVTLRSRTAV
ncbi:MAG: hypothetical protein U0792_23780 [Gemmataceae bacterium]